MTSTALAAVEPMPGFMHHNFIYILIPIQKFEKFTLRLNQFLPARIAIKRCIPVHEKAHSRFDAKLRAYEYHITFQKIHLQPI